MARAKDVTERAVDNFCDSVESLLIALSQRSMTPAQIFRLGRVLDEGRAHLLARSTSSEPRRTKRVA